MIARASALLAVFLLVPACVSLDPPRGYVAITPPTRPYVLEAVSSVNCRFRVREVRNEKNGSLEFWADAVKNELVLNRGYELVSTEPTTPSSGLEGCELLFRTTASGVEYRYFVAIVRRSSWLYVVEAGGLQAAFEADLSDIRSAVAALR